METNTRSNTQSLGQLHITARFVIYIKYQLKSFLIGQRGIFFGASQSPSANFSPVSYSPPSLLHETKKADSLKFSMSTKLDNGPAESQRRPCSL